MNINKSTEPIAINVFYGDASNFDRSSLKAYKCENELKRIVNKNQNVLKYFLNNKFSLPSHIEVKVTEPGDPNPVVENFSLIELINNKLTSSNSSVCVSIYETYQKDGIVEAISKLHKISPLTTI